MEQRQGSSVAAIEDLDSERAHQHRQSHLAGLELTTDMEVSPDPRNLQVNP